MAELLLKVDRGSNFDDGDILCAFNRRSIRCCHAQHICHIRKAKRNGSGLILPTEVARDWFEATHQYRFDRLSATEIQRTMLATGDIDFISDKPNEMGEYMDVRLFIARRKRKPDHYLFGEDGAEIWYGGRIDMSHGKLDRVWNAIETKTPQREAEHGRWPMGRLDVRHHLPIAVDEFDDDEANDLVSPELDETDPEKPVVIQKRKHDVKWRDVLELSRREIEQVRDRGQIMDLRERKEFKRAEKVRRKVRRRR